jgi:predicted DCC family thiol-disulfide oxidoreductase YuxK
MVDAELPDIKPDDQIILFDGVCKLCNHWSRFILRVDKHERFKLCSVQSPQGQALLAAYGFPLDQFETMLLVRKEAYLTHSDAFIAIMQGLPFPRRVLAVLRWLPKSLRDAGYGVIARNRYRVFGRYDRCGVPPEGYERRFLR